MRPMYGCLENFRESLNTPMTTFPIDPMNVRTKFEVRSFTRSRANRGTLKLWTVPGYAHAHFSQKFLMGFVRMDRVNVPAKFGPFLG